MKPDQLSLSTRIFVLIGILCAGLIGIGAVGLAGIAKASDGTKAVPDEGSISMGQVAEIQHHLLTNRLIIANSMINPAPYEIARNTAEIEANISAITNLLDGYMTTVLTSEEKILAKQFTEDRTRFVQEGLQPTIAALRSNKIKEANRLVGERIRPLFIPVGAGIQALLSASWRRPSRNSRLS